MFMTTLGCNHLWFYPLVYFISTYLIWILAKPLDKFDLFVGTDAIPLVWNNSLEASTSVTLL